MVKVDLVEMVVAFFLARFGSSTCPDQQLGEKTYLSTAADLGDLEGDGDLDVFIVGLRTGYSIWLNDGFGHFSNNGSFPGATTTIGTFSSIKAIGPCFSSPLA